MVVIARASRCVERDHLGRRRGISAVEVLVVVAILALLALVVAMALPRRRETARLAACQDHLRHIGVALALYDQMSGALPMAPALEPGGAAAPAGPLKVLLETLGMPDLMGLSDARKPPVGSPGTVIAERPVPGFVCASDPNATAGRFPAPVSYRATTGDAPEGRNGAFAPGRRVSLAAIEAGDGTSYTAGFAERFVGNGRQTPDSCNYARVPGPLGPGGCPRSVPSAWRGDAGASWVASDWQSTLYNHALTPDQAPSCIAEDGQSAYMGASSGHPNGVNVLHLDGSVRTCTPRIDPKVWDELATANTTAATPSANSPAP